MRIRHIKGAEEYLSQSPFVIDEPARFQGKWREEAFGRRVPLFLEVGMGMGTFLRTHAFRHPGINYIGFEINSTVLYKSLTRYLKSLSETTGESGQEELLAHSNLRLIRQDARFLTDDFATGEVDRIYLNFSDPWPKDKNANKRLTSPIFLDRYKKILAPGGEIEFKTDNQGLFDYSLETFPACGYQLRLVTRDLHASPELCADNVMTEYEAKFSQKGNPICKLIAVR